MKKIKMINYLLYGLVLLLGFPVGILLNFLCDDEMKVWKSRMRIASLVCLILIVGVYFSGFLGFAYRIPVMLTLVFAIIMFMSVGWKR